MNRFDAQEAAIRGGESPETKALRARIAELEAALRDAVDELTTCELMLSGETYNNPRFNRLLGIDAENQDR